MSKSDGGAVVVAFMLGAVAGAAVALLMAPTTGEEMRRMLGEKAREGADRASDAARQGRELVNRGREKLSTAVDRGRGGVRARERQRCGGRGRGEPVNGDWSVAFLGVIAGATLVMALTQVGAFVAAWRLARQAQQIMTSVQQDVGPLVARAHAIADEAARTVAIATAQAQKVDRLVTDLSRRVEETAAVVQEAIITPAREGLAIIAGIRAGLSALRGFRDSRSRNRRHAEEEDPLFIG